MSNKISRRALADAITTKLLAADADTGHVMQTLAAYLVDHNMTQHADAIMNDIGGQLLERAGLLPVEVVSARPLAPETREQLIGFLKEQTGATQVDLHESIDETMIGGLVARTPFGELDTSIRSKLRQLTTMA